MRYSHSLRMALAASAALLGFLGCGGGSSSSSSSSGLSLVYANPAASSTDYTLVKDSASTASSLVLDLVGPATNSSTGLGTAAVGITFSFDVDTSQATWGTSPVVSNGNVFSLGSGTRLAQGWVTGQQLQGIISNKGTGAVVSNVSLSTSGTAGVIGRIQLNLASGATAGAVTLVDGGLSTYLDASGGVNPMVVQVGTLTVQ